MSVGGLTLLYLAMRCLALCVNRVHAFSHTLNARPSTHLPLPDQLHSCDSGETSGARLCYAADMKYSDP